MDIEETNKIIRPEIESFKSSSFKNIIEVKALRLTHPKVPHSGFNIDVRKPSILPEISLEEVSNHDLPSDCWIVVYDRVYNVTKFLESHPGGEDVILDYAGRDATLAFRGTGHSKAALKLLEDHIIGELPNTQRIFRTNNDFFIQLSDLPE